MNASPIRASQSVAPGDYCVELSAQGYAVIAGTTYYGSLFSSGLGTVDSNDPNNDTDVVITVTLSADTSLNDAASKTIRLVPADAGGNALTAASIGGTQVGTFLCGPGTANGIDKKYLPGSCKS